MLTRIALFADIHANLTALDAVLADIDANGVEDRFCLGDLVGYGPDPAEVVDRIRRLGVSTIRGNYDEGVGTRHGGCGCHYATDQARADGVASYAFTDAALDDGDHAWLASLPETIRLDIDGLRIVLAHGSPRKNNEYLLPDRQDAQLVRLAEQAGADLVCVGHVHIPYHRAMAAPGGARIHYVSSGSVGKPKDGDPRACWIELLVGDRASIEGHSPDDAAASACGSGDTWVGVIIHRVEYDVEAVAARMRDSGLPDTLIDALRTA